MFVNCDKFQAILLVKQKSDCAGTKLTVGSEETRVVSSVEVLSITIGTKYSGMDQVKFSLSRPYPFKYFKGYRVCKSASRQLNAIIRLKNFLGFEERKVLIIVLHYRVLITVL